METCLNRHLIATDHRVVLEIHEPNISAVDYMCIFELINVKLISSQSIRTVNNRVKQSLFAIAVLPTYKRECKRARASSQKDKRSIAIQYACL